MACKIFLSSSYVQADMLSENSRLNWRKFNANFEAGCRHIFLRAFAEDRACSSRSSKSLQSRSIDRYTRARSYKGNLKYTNQHVFIYERRITVLEKEVGRANAKMLEAQPETKVSQPLFRKRIHLCRAATPVRSRPLCTLHSSILLPCRR